MLLDVAGLSLQHGATLAVRDVSFTIARGESLGIVGESGSGKSSIAQAILGQGSARQTDGHILLEGTRLDTLGPPQRRAILGRRIGWVPQDPFTALNPALRIGWQIAEPMVHHLRLTRREALRRACDLLAEVGIDDPASASRRYPHQMSGGMRQRVLIAVAISCSPPLLVLDEPTTALDVTVEARILALLANLRERRGVGMLFISHNLGVVQRVCVRVGVLYAGQMVEQGSARAIIGQPAHPYGKGLLAARPRLGTPIPGLSLASIPGTMADAPDPARCCAFAPRCPFTEPRCQARQDMRRLNDRAVRCWKAETAGAWPVPAARPAMTGTGAAPHPVIEGLALTKSFGHGGWPRSASRKARVPAVAGVSLAVASGEVVGLVGESGCGKSTLGRLLLRLLSLDAGRIVFEGRDLTLWKDAQLRPVRLQAQLVFQSVGASLNPRLTIGQALDRPTALLGRASPRDRKRRVDELLSMVQLPTGYAVRYPNQLSGGEKQRVAIARALATNPRFLVCDEPTSALDVSVQASIINLLTDLRHRLGLSYLFVSHDIALVSQTADRIAVMFRGTICETGTVADVMAPPYHPYTRTLLALAAGAEMPGDAAPGEAPSPRGCRYRHRCQFRVDPICADSMPVLSSSGEVHAIACHFPVGFAAPRNDG